jgi:hypothetical protein
MHSKARNIAIQKGKLAPLPALNSLQERAFEKASFGANGKLQLDKRKDQGA